jgi:phage tail-like protein
MPWGKKPKIKKKLIEQLPEGFWGPSGFTGKKGLEKLGSKKLSEEKSKVESIESVRKARKVYPILKQFFDSNASGGGATRESNWKLLKKLHEILTNNEKDDDKKKKSGFVKDPVIKQSLGINPIYDKDSQAGTMIDLPDFVKDPVIKQYFPSTQATGSNASSGKRAYSRRGKKPSRKPSGNLDWHVGTWNFKVSIDGIPMSSSSFQSVSGINTETEMIEFKFGPDPFMRTIPGKTKFGAVELSRVYKMGSLELYNWRRLAESGIDNVSRNVRVDVYGTNLSQAPVMSLVLHDCFPKKWECPELNAGSSEGAIEKISLDVSRVTTSLGGTKKPTKYD